MKKPLFKTTIVIWSPYDPTNLEVDELVMDAVHGESYCSMVDTFEVEDPTSDDCWDGTEFFGINDFE